MTEPQQGLTITPDELRNLQEYRAQVALRAIPNLPVEIPGIYAAVCDLKLSLEALIGKYGPPPPQPEPDPPEDPAQKDPT